MGVITSFNFITSNFFISFYQEKYIILHSIYENVLIKTANNHFLSSYDRLDKQPIYHTFIDTGCGSIVADNNNRP